MVTFGQAEFDLSQYLGKVDTAVQLNLSNAKISQTFIEFNITIEEPEKMEKTVLFIFNAKNKENGVIEDDGEGEGPDTPATPATLGSQVSQISEQIDKPNEDEGEGFAESLFDNK